MRRPRRLDCCGQSRVKGVRYVPPKMGSWGNLLLCAKRPNAWFIGERQRHEINKEKSLDGGGGAIEWERYGRERKP